MRRLPEWTERQALDYAERAIDDQSRKFGRMTVTDLRQLYKTLGRALKMAEAARKAGR